MLSKIFTTESTEVHRAVPQSQANSLRVFPLWNSVFSVAGLFRSLRLNSARESHDKPRSATTPDLHAASILASSTSRMGMSSRTGYTRRHSAHFRLSPSACKASGFLQTGQTRISSKSCGIMSELYCTGRGSAASQVQIWSGFHYSIVSHA